jgi:hypothetical protein
MRGLFTNQPFSMHPGEAISGIAKRNETLRIASGRVWITVEGISHDYFLHAGDMFTAIPGRLTVLEADQDARIEPLRPAALTTWDGLRRLAANIAQRLQQGATVQTSLQRHNACCSQC